jgi:integrase
MSLWKRGGRYWADFMVDGVRFRKALKTSDRNIAIQRERETIEIARYGRLGARETGPRNLFAAIDAYLDAKRMRCSARTLELESERLSVLKRHFGDLRVASVTAGRIAEYQRARHDAGVANRTINMDVGVLRRVLKSCGRWRALADHVENLPERQRPVGRALTADERVRLFEAAASNPEWEHVHCAAVVAANTSLRPVEVKHLRRQDVDLARKLLYVRRSKNETSHRVIPLNGSAIKAISRMLERADLLEHTAPEHFIWPACQWGRFDATQPMLKWDTAWRALRDAAGLPGLRFHDLRHTVITELAELGVADHVLESISGHLSRRMLEHYSHIRIDAKRQALNALDDARRRECPDAGPDKKSNNHSEIPAIVELLKGFTSQSRHNLRLSGSPPSAKLLIPLARRDVRVVEGARLESVCRGNSTVGSNPTLSANQKR